MVKGSFGQAFFDLENLYLQTEKIKNNRYTKIHIQKLHDKIVNTNSTIMGNSTLKIRKLKKIMNENNKR